METAEALWALRRDDAPGDVERLRRFARGVSLFRAERPEDFATLKAALLDFRERLQLLRAGTTDLAEGYRPATVASFVARMLASLVFGRPVRASGDGRVRRSLPGAALAVQALKPEQDIVATYKLLGGLMLLSPVVPGPRRTRRVGMWGPGWGLGVLVCSPPLALWTRHAVEAWGSRARDIRLFFQLGSRSALRRSLLAEGETLAAEVEREAQTYLAPLGRRPPGNRQTSPVSSATRERRGTSGNERNISSTRALIQGGQRHRDGRIALLRLTCAQLGDRHRRPLRPFDAFRRRQTLELRRGQPRPVVQANAVQTS